MAHHNVLIVSFVLYWSDFLLVGHVCEYGNLPSVNEKQLRHFLTFANDLPALHKYFRVEVGHNFAHEVLFGVKMVLFVLEKIYEAVHIRHHYFSKQFVFQRRGEVFVVRKVLKYKSIAIL